MITIPVKKLRGAVLVTAVAVAVVGLNHAAQDVETPISQNTGRIVKLKKIAVSHDDNGDFIFKNPGNILGIKDGEFFVKDNGKVLKFTADGNFVKTVVSKGEGPGEATYLNQLYKRKNELIVNTGFMRKLMVFDFDGELKGEYRERMTKKSLAKRVGYSDIAYHILAHKEDGSLLVLRPTISPSKKEKLKKDSVFLISAENEWQDKLFEIPIDSIVVDLGSMGFTMLPKISVISVCDREFLYFSNTARYEIKKYNIKNNKIETILKRRYNPIPIPKELTDEFFYGGVSISGTRNGKEKVVRAPQPKFFHDIVRLFVVNGHVWVMTSTFDKEKGVLFDVYNREGKYSDNFYISFPGVSNEADFIKNEIHIFNGYLFKKETDVEGNFMVVKYEIVDAAKTVSAEIL